MTTHSQHVDHELIQAAADVARTRCRDDNDTVAGAAQARGGRTIAREPSRCDHGQLLTEAPLYEEAVQLASIDVEQASQWGNAVQLLGHRPLAPLGEGLAQLEAGQT